MKPVLLVGNFFSSSIGTRSYCEELACQMTRSGWPVLTTSYKRGRVSRLFDMVGTVLRNRERYSVAQVDVYSGPAFFWAEAVCCALKLVGKPYLLTLHGGNLPNFARRWPGRVRRLLNSAVIVTAPSGYLLKQMEPYRSGLRLLPNSMDLNTYTFRLRPKAEPRLLWLRAFHSIYNPGLAPRAIARLRESFPELRLTMIGPDRQDGSLQSTIETAAKEGVSENILLPGSVAKDQVPGWLNGADIFLNTTNVDNTPVSIMEAMASGLCIVSTNVGGISYLLEHERDALLVPPDDPEAMAGAVRRLLTEPELAARLSNNARRKAEEFDWATVLPKWKELLTAASKRCAA
jgi:glycosyltransferase involved in cell wall biosynthesis